MAAATVAGMTSRPVAELPRMPDYGVTRDAWRPLDWSWAAERLARTRNFWVVTASADARPHPTPVWGVWDDDAQRFAFSCGPRSRKARDLAANPHVAVAVDDTVECLTLEGRAHVVTDEPGRVAWAERYVARYREHSAELTTDFVLAHLVVEVTPDRALAVIERDEDFATRATRWRFPEA